MTVCEEKYKTACMNNKITFFDYDTFVKEGSKSIYDSNFISNLPDLYFLGLPIKEIIKSDYSNGLCHFLSLALGLCFDDFELVISNQRNYLEIYNKINNTSEVEFEHTYIIVNINGIKKVIDIPRGIIMDFHTYYDVFGIKEKYKITKDELLSVPAVKLMYEHKNEISPKIVDDNKDVDKIKKYTLFIKEYLELCEKYTNPYEFKLEYFIKRCLPSTSGWSTINRLTSIIKLNNIYSYFKDEGNTEIKTHNNA